MLDYENKAKARGYQILIGVDEAGRGPLAGPVVAAAVYLKDYQFTTPIRDSKKLSPQKREQAFLEIFDKAYVGIGIMNEKVIDDQNILKATYLAMSVAVRQMMFKYTVSHLHQQSAERKILLMIDGPSFQSDLAYPFETIIDGDSLSLSIACASIIAKVTRDRILNIYDRIYPQYGFRWHKGYPTRLHKKAIQKNGPSVIHRQTFNMV